MKEPQKGILLRIFVGENDRLNGKPLYEEIVRHARELHIAGATVVRGIMGYGAASKIHTAKVLRLSDDMPMIIEMVDEKEKIDLIIPFLDEHVEEGLITMERVEVIRYRHD
jgi:hypothetical protein